MNRLLLSTAFALSALVGCEGPPPPTQEKPGTAAERGHIKTSQDQAKRPQVAIDKEKLIAAKVRVLGMT